MKNILLVVACMAIAGCANLKFQWSASYATENLIEDLRRVQTGHQAKQPGGEASK